LLSNNGGEDAVVLLNSRTTGVFSLIADCEAVFEGKATYFEPDLTRAFIKLISETNDFYDKPSMDFLDKYGITHIIITESEEISFGGNMIDTIEPSIDPLYKAVFLEEAKVFGPVHVFKVIR
jgi:hypothetical protein